MTVLSIKEMREIPERLQEEASLNSQNISPDSFFENRTLSSQKNKWQNTQRNTSLIEEEKMIVSPVLDR